MAEFLLFTAPAVVYVLVQRRGPGTTTQDALGRIGARWGAPSAYAWALALLIPLLVIAWSAVTLVPAEVLGKQGVTAGQVASVVAALGVALRATGEEVFFRGLLGGIFTRRLGFGWGNLLQAAVFLLPHLMLLAVDARLWPIVPVQFASGWLLGWLRHRTGTFVPGAAVHSVTNLATGFLVG